MNDRLPGYDHVVVLTHIGQDDKGWYHLCLIGYTRAVCKHFTRHYCEYLEQQGQEE